jgi:hypothetical protein
MARKPNWKTLRTPNGTATKVPKLIQSMTDSSSRIADIRESVALLRGMVVSKNAWASASGPLPSPSRSIRGTKAQDRSTISGLLATSSLASVGRPGFLAGSLYLRVTNGTKLAW